MDHFKSLSVTVRRKTAETPDVFSLELVAAENAALPSFSAGAHIDLHCPNGLVRQYSICNTPGSGDHYLIGVLREPQSRGGSNSIHDSVREGDRLVIGAPRNHFQLREEAPRSLLLAGGIGITPLLSMAGRLSTIQAAFELHYCARSRERAAFVQHIETSAYAGSTTFHFSNGRQEGRLDFPALLSRRVSGTHLYVCGPRSFVKAAQDCALAYGWPEDAVHREYFAGEPVEPARNREFRVRLASTGAVLVVKADKSVAETLIEHGIDLPMSCEQGVCGTCLTRLLAGVPDHRDSYLTPEEHARNDVFMPCCSRAKDDLLVLDL